MPTRKWYHNFFSLRFRIIASVVAIEIVMLSILVANNAKTIYDTHTDRLNDTAQSIVSQFSERAASLLAEVDYDTLEEYAQTVLRHREVAYILLQDIDGNSVVAVGRNINLAPIRDQHPTLVDDGVFDVSANVFLSDQLQGVLTIGFSLELMNETIATAREKSILIALTEIFLTIFVTILLGARLTRGLNSLSDAADRISDGDYDVRLRISDRDEIGKTAVAFNKMAEELSLRTEKMKDAIASAKTISETSQDGLISYNQDGLIQTANESSLNMLGCRAEDLLGVNVRSLVASGQDNEILETWFNPDKGKHTEAVLTRKNGEPLPVEISIGYRTKGEQHIYVATLRDITERIKENAIIARQNTVLEKCVSKRPLAEIYEHLCFLVEEQVTNSAAVIIQATNNPGELILAAAPQHEEGFKSAFSACLQIQGEYLYSAVLNRRETIVATDDNTDELSRWLRGFCQNFGFQSCWLSPFFSNENSLLGILVVIVRNATRPSKRDFEVTLTASSLAAMASKQNKITQELYEEKEWAFQTLRAIGDGVITTDADGKITSMNPVAEKLTGWSIENASGKPLSDVFVLVNEHTKERLPDPACACLEKHDAFGMSEHALLMSQDGESYAVEDSAALIKNAQNAVVGVVIVFKDVTEARLMAKKLAHQAAHDSLTGLANRRSFEQRLELALSDAFESHSEHALCYMDLDQFKIVNDTCGHVAGDELLRQLSAILHGHVRASDILARLGGDEFGLLLENCPLEKAKSIAGNICRNVQDYRFLWQKKSFDVGVSIGLVPITRHSQSVHNVLSQADVACYMAKELGRNRVYVYQLEDLELAQRHTELHWAMDLSDAVEKQNFRLYVQEILPTNPEKDRRMYEILVRYMHPETGQEVLPSAFIPAAERYNLIRKIDRWVIGNAIRHLAALSSLSDDNIHFTINISGISLGDKDLKQFIRAQLNEYNLSSTRLCFEVTETAAIANLTAASNFMCEMREIGCRFALDDFGSGLSSFSYLKHLPVDYIKIDGSFVCDVTDDRVNEAMVKSIIQIGHVMGIQTIAECVEDHKTVDHLVSLGIDFIQGNVINKPQPVSSLLVLEESLIEN